jgi:hypothetical protein
VSLRPPLPPVARVSESLPLTVAGEEQHTLPGWVAALIYLACTGVLGYAICTRLL